MSQHYDIMIVQLKTYTTYTYTQIYYNKVYISHIHITIHKLYMSKSSKTKLTDLHYIGDKNYSESKLSQKAIIL